MSHYTLVKTKITRKSALIKALYKMGFKEIAIEDSKTKLPLRGYRGDTREQQANIRIKGSGWKTNYVGRASNDLGWELLEDGTYSLHLSEYDRIKYNQDWQDKLMQNYSREVILEIAQENNFTIELEENTKNEITLTLTNSFI